MLHLFIKKAIDQRKVMIDLSAYYQTYQKSLKDIFTNRCLNFVKEYHLNTDMVFEKDIVHNML